MHRLLLLLPILSGCALLSPEKPPGGLESSWIWERSAGGFAGWVWTRDSLSYTPRIDFLPGNQYIFYRNEQPLHTGSYRIQEFSDREWLLTFDFSEETFAWPLAGERWSPVLFRQSRARLEGDSMLRLIDACVDCYTHRFRRIK